MYVINKEQSWANASFECAKLCYSCRLIFCVLFSSHYNRLLKSREKFKQWHLQFFEALARRDSRIARRESRIERRESRIARQESRIARRDSRLGRGW